MLKSKGHAGFQKFLQQQSTALTQKPQLIHFEKEQRIYILQSHVGVLIEFSRDDKEHIKYLASSGMENCIGLIMWVNLTQNTTRGLLTHLDEGCSSSMKYYIPKFVGMFGNLDLKFNASLVLPFSPNKTLLETSREELAKFKEIIEYSEKEDKVNHSTDFYLDLDKGITSFYKESVIGISAKGSKLSLNHPSKQILSFFKLSNGELKDIYLPDKIEITPRQILCLACILGDTDKVYQILTANSDIDVNEIDIETGSTLLHYAIYTMIGQSKLEDFILGTKSDIIIEKVGALESSIKRSIRLETKKNWEVDIVQKLLSSGACVITNNKTGITPSSLLSTAIDSFKRSLSEQSATSISKEHLEILERSMATLREAESQQQAICKH